MSNKTTSSDFGRSPRDFHADVSARSSTVFSTLEVPINDRWLPAAINERWVAPYYMTHFGPQLSSEQKKALQIDRQDADISVLRNLLGEFNWRHRVVAAKFAALNGAHELEEHIGRLLLRSDLTYAGNGYTLALATFNTPTSIGFLEKYLEYYLTRTDLNYNQSVVAGAVNSLDTINGTDIFLRYSSLWNDYPHAEDLTVVTQRFSHILSDLVRLRNELDAATEQY